CLSDRTDYDDFMVAAVGPNSVRIAEDLEDLVDVRPSVISALNLHKTLTAAYKSAVDLVKVDHSGLILYHTGYSTGGVCAEFPEEGTYGGIRALVIVPVLGKEQVLISTAIIAERIGNDH